MRANLIKTYGLTEREADVVAQIARGVTNGEAAAALGITEKTVKNVLTIAPLKMGVERGGSLRVRLALKAHGIDV